MSNPQERTSCAVGSGAALRRGTMARLAVDDRSPLATVTDTM
jgi:hypothetical protein